MRPVLYHCSVQKCLTKLFDFSSLSYTQRKTDNLRKTLRLEFPGHVLKLIKGFFVTIELCLAFCLMLVAQKI